MKTGDAKLNELLAECDAYVASMREELRQIRPQLLALKELYQSYIDQLHLVLFVSSARLPSGGYVNLPPKVEQECEAAVVAVLKRKLAKVEKALGEKK